MMKLDFVKLSPTQNTTILVTTPVSRESHVALAEKLMACDSVQAEQVGFLEPASLKGARIRLQMMGGEFCGNASMSVGAFLADQDKLPDGAEAVYPLEVSGAEGIVSCRVRREGNAYLGTVAMPLPNDIREITFADGFRCPVVFLPGIAHAIIPGESMSRHDAEARVAKWCAETGQDAFGILLTTKDGIEPLVYVRATDSAVWERGCGSGSAALAAYTAHREQGNVSLPIRQPGGGILAEADYNEHFQEIRISGTVKITVAGQAWLDSKN